MLRKEPQRPAVAGAEAVVVAATLFRPERYPSKPQNPNASHWTDPLTFPER